MADEDDLPEQLRIRREKRAAILKRGAEPYPVAVPRTSSLSEIRLPTSDYRDIHQITYIRLHTSDYT